MLKSEKIFSFNSFDQKKRDLCKNNFLELKVSGLIAPAQIQLITSFDVALTTDWYQFTGTRTKRAFMSAAAESSLRQLPALCLALFIIRHQAPKNLLETINANSKNSGVPEISGPWTDASLSSALTVKIIRHATIVNTEKHYVEQWNLEDNIRKFRGDLLDSDVKSMLKSIFYLHLTNFECVESILSKPIKNGLWTIRWQSGWGQSGPPTPIPDGDPRPPITTFHIGPPQPFPFSLHPNHNPCPVSKVNKLMYKVIGHTEF